MFNKIFFKMMTILLGVMLIFSMTACSKQSKDGDNTNSASVSSTNESKQDTQSNAETAKEMEKLYSDMEAGKITPEEYQRRLLEMSGKMMNDLGLSGIFEQMDQQQKQLEQEEYQRNAQQEQQRLEQEGDTAGWPPASVFTKLGLKNIQQPAGTSTRYTDHGNLYIWISKANTKTLQNLKQNAEAALDKKIEGDDDSFSVGLDRSVVGSDGTQYGYILWVSATLEYNVIVFSFVLTN